ncbi:hypothetical protein ILFOPFJJ_06759 [Ensifer psoraleae]|uniref:hypothetical protein n=1 Tax=Sinorhizobium psoraleae TaxID=520838 RepID=UPI00156A502C|nr:hypothetical protein [Sinorhizobium psoraleae]NRP75836.1 hypothetical protein [Sinorhizobium psoraleae]
MKTDMSAYGVTDLTPEEAAAIAGGWGVFGAITFGVVTLVAYAVATIVEGVVRDKIHHG